MYKRKALFEDGNAWVSLSEIFTSILQDLDLNNAYLIIDALDECVADLPKLLNFIGQKSSMSLRIKWVISSRNWPDIEERRERAGCYRSCDPESCGAPGSQRALRVAGPRSVYGPGITELSHMV